jgi:hypothetical protein
MTYFIQSYIITLMMDMRLVSETSDLITPLTRLFARETYIEFCRRENFKTDITDDNFVSRKAMQTFLRPEACRILNQGPSGENISFSVVPLVRYSGSFAGREGDHWSPSSDGVNS